MTKKEYCLKHPAVAYYSGFSGLEIHGFEYGINDYVYCVSNAWTAPSKYKYHKLKIQYDNNGAFFKLNGYRIPLDECITMGV